MMELFSLEEDECNDLFITQTPTNNGVSNVSSGDSVTDSRGDGGHANENALPVYSDISDIEDFDIPSSQPLPKIPR